MIVYIEEINSMADVTFPSLPHVVSLLHYDIIARTPDSLHPPAGYPVICVTVSRAEVILEEIFLELSGIALSTKTEPQHTQLQHDCCKFVTSVTSSLTSACCCPARTNLNFWKVCPLKRHTFS